MSKQQNLRYEAQKFQELLLEAISNSKSNNIINNIDDKYLKISSVIEFIENAINPFLQNQEKYDNTVFVMGPTGAGKSTLINYLAGKELFFQLKNYKPGIFPKEENEIAYIGRGGGSTTLTPNIWHANTSDFADVTFIDCAGDFDSSGTIVEIINSKIKTIIAQNVNNAKILIVSSQDSIGASGSYGVLFKEGLEKSAQFLNDITYFNESMAFVVSHAERMSSTPKIVESYLSTAIKEPKLEKYKQSLEKIISNGNFVTFSKYSDESEENSVYLPPSWNPNQREKIIDVINKIQFQRIPQNFFNDSSSHEVREHMSRAFEIVKNKAAETLKLSFEKAISYKLVIYAAALKPFVNFVEKFLIYKKYETGLMEYINDVNKLHFFKLVPSKEILKVVLKLHQKLKTK